MKHLHQNLEGVENMAQLPDAMFVIDSNAEEIAVKEARRMGVPVIAVVDTNCDPDVVDWVIPGNDDALRAIRLFTSKIADSVLEGQGMAKDVGVPAPKDEDGEDGEPHEFGPSGAPREHIRAKRADTVAEGEPVEAPNEASAMM